MLLDFRKFSSRSFDWTLLVAAVLLIIIGLVAIYSVDLSRGSSLIYFKKQMLAFGIGLVLVFFAVISQHTLWQFLAKWSYLAGLLLLVAVLIFGNTIRGTRGWFAFAGFSFQPVEAAKVGLILVLAYIISKFGRRFDRPLFFFGTGIVALLYLVLVMLQPDLGSAFLLASIWFGLVWAAGARKSYILIFVAAIAALAVLGWVFLLKDYQKERLATFINPGRDPLGAGYNITQSIIAVGAGKFFGRGLGFGSQSQLRFLPEAKTDFIFSVIGEELGFAGVVVMLALFAIVFWRLIVFIKNSDDDFASAAATGILVLFFIQFLTNIGANIGLLPITGVTLPFVSYGGSSLIFSLLLIGLAESMMVRRY
ncbi:MAG: rod shape-determining protein RodA [Patescibacteria group bacterium]